MLAFRPESSPPFGGDASRGLETFRNRHREGDEKWRIGGSV
jgi:hypothetical protein